MELRPYQNDAVDALFDYWDKGGGNPLIEMATGTGKSLVIADATKRLLTDYPGLRVVMLVHVRELVEQNAQALLRAWPQCPLGINSAGLGRRDRHSQVLFASIQSAFRDDGYSLGERHLVLIDEAHLVPTAGEGMYRTFLDNLRQREPDLRVCGFTATPYRLGSGRIDQGHDRLFDKTVFTYGIAQGVKDGYLTPLIAKGTSAEINVAGVKRRGGEFVAGSLEAAADNASLIDAACTEIIERGADRKSWLLFCAGVSHAMNVRDALRAKGIEAAVVTGETPSGERASIFRDFKAGRVRALCGMNVFTTGFDAPGVDLVAMLRPTLSTGLYVQMLGRGTRLAPGKTDCLVLDYAGNVRRHGPVDDVSVSRGPSGDASQKEAGVTPDTVRARLCPECGTYNSIAARFCVECDYEWPVKHEKAADVTPIMASRGPAWVPVTDVQLFKHVKQDSPISLRVEYQCGMQVHREWVCFEHRNYPRLKAEAWWRMFDGKTPVPGTVAEAMGRAAELALPCAVTLKRDGKYWRVAGYRFDKGSSFLEFDENYKARVTEKEEAA